jgi:quinol monooxygenase YgiN
MHYQSPTALGAMTMVLEIAELYITPGAETAFTEAHVAAINALESSDGMLSLKLTQGVETPTQFVMMVEWTDLEAHERFRETEGYARWRAAIGPFVSGPARIQHTRVVA